MIRLWRRKPGEDLVLAAFDGFDVATVFLTPADILELQVQLAEAAQRTRITTDVDTHGHVAIVETHGAERI
jgi:hypothetical protein